MPPRKQTSRTTTARGAAVAKAGAGTATTASTRVPTRKATTSRTRHATAATDDTEQLAEDMAEQLIVEDRKEKGRARTAPTSRVRRDEQTTPEPSSEEPKVAKGAKTTARSQVRQIKAPSRSRTADNLAEELADKLIIDAKGKRRAVSTVSEEQQCIDAMKAVNVVSKSLAAVLRSGWKASSAVAPALPAHKAKATPASPSVSSISEQATSARECLETLRELRPGEVDVERSAASLAGKFISLEMYDCALDLLRDAYNPIIGLYNPTRVTRPIPLDRELLSLPLPPTKQDIPNNVQAVIGTYLTHTLAALFNTACALEDLTHDDLDALYIILHTQDTLLQWLPYLRSLASDQLDATLTRAFSALSTSTSLLHDRTPEIAAVIYRVRHYGVLCLAHASPAAFDPSVFWSQAAKFANSYIHNVERADDGQGGTEHVTSVAVAISQSFDQLVEQANQRADKEMFFSGRGYVAFCQYWMSIAKRAKELHTLERVRQLINSTQPSTPVHGIATATERSARQRQTDSHDAVEAARLYALLVQATSILEQNDLDAAENTKCLKETLTCMPSVASFLQAWHQDTTAHSDDARHAEKVSRSFERLRRAAVKALESFGTSSRQAAGNGAQSAVVQRLLTNALVVLENVIPHAPQPQALLTSVLDGLLALSRATLAVSDPATYPPAFDFLSRGVSLLEQHCAALDTLAHANFLRCISTAFHNLASLLCQASRFDFAVRFLDQTCALGEKAIDMRRGAATQDGGEVDEKMGEVWDQAEDQLYRRWEILAICHLKTGDRKSAFRKFVNAVKAFPFHRYASNEVAGEVTCVQLVWSSPSLKRIADIIDRLTYVGLCDLYLEPAEVSLRSALEGVFVGDLPLDPGTARRAIVGAVLERQVDSLNSSVWKPKVRAAVVAFQHDLLEIYDANQMPIRRARVLLKRLELMYHSSHLEHGFGDDADVLSQTAQEAEYLLTVDDAHCDERLAQLQPYYLAMLKLRLALLTHRSAQTSRFSKVVAYAEEACVALKSLTSPEPVQARPKDPGPARGSKKPAGRAQTATSRTTARSRGKTVKTASAVPMTPKRKPLAKPLAVTSPESGPDEPPSFSKFDEIPQLISLLRATAQLLGLLGQVITKVHLLLQARRLLEKSVATRPDDFVRLSVDLAHEYVKLGKTKKGAAIYKHTLSLARTLSLSEETRVLFLLRYSESLAVTGDVLKSSTTYCDASGMSENLPDAEKGMTTVQRVSTHSTALERGAIAANTFALIQNSRDDLATSIQGLLQSLRLWNRALDSLQRLLPPTPKSNDDSNPFLAEEPKPSSQVRSGSIDVAPPVCKLHGLPALDGLEWRIASGLLNIQFALANAYLTRGSPREAEYFVRQALGLAESLGAPAMASRAHARLGEIQLHLGQLEDSHASLTRAAELVADVAGPVTAEIQHLRAEYSRRSADEKGAQQLYEEAMAMLQELDNTFIMLDGPHVGPRPSLGASPSTPAVSETLAPELLASILRQSIWLLHGEGEEYQELLDHLQTIAGTSAGQAEQSALMGKLSLESVYSRLQTDMFLSSLAESTITLPMGVPASTYSMPASTQEILSVLGNAEKMFWSEYGLVSKRGKVFQVRDTAVSLALAQAFEVALGKVSAVGPTLATRLLDSSVTITLRREMLEAIEHKFLEPDGRDDLRWPAITSNGSPLPPKKRKNALRFDVALADESDEDVFQEKTMKDYWSAIRRKYESYGSDARFFSVSQADELPDNWTVVSISVTEDRNTMFVTRSRPRRDPLVVCIPLKERRESDEEQLSFDDALAELREIIELSDEGTKQAVQVRNDREGRAEWWANRNALDQRLKELLENMEFCWLGAFKAILSRPVHVPDDLLDGFRASIERIFQRSIVLKDRRQTVSVHLDNALVECFASLSPISRDEELEDVIYFILDIYQFHGIPVASAEVDIDQAVIDLRSALEDYNAKSQGHIREIEDTHLFLVLDKNVQAIPWESMPSLRGRSVSRIPSLDFLLDRLELAKQHDEGRGRVQRPGEIAVDPRSVFYVLNPSGDLKNTEARFVDMLKDMKKFGWEGVVGRPPSEQQLCDAFTHKDIVLYFGHGGAEQYIRSHKVRHLPRCAVTMLWGCSSGLLRDMGDFDRTGTPYNYMLAGCPCLVATLWDVTDRDIDKFAQSVFDNVSLSPSGVGQWTSGDRGRRGTSVITAVAQSREACKLKYLTGAAPVVYGIPFYL